jgi:hypothetical protein
MQTSSPPSAFAFETTKLYQAIRLETQDGLKTFCQSGNLKHREKQVAEWLKSLEWLSWEEVSPSLHKLPLSLKAALKQDFQTYQAGLSSVKAKQSEQRKQYQLNVMAYFKENMPPKDKALLESLRDYELNLTGRDANWQHHFSFKSFKKIDAFIQASHSERVMAIQAFQQDVDTYVKNKEKWQRLATMSGEEGPGFDFDDWCDWVISADEETPDPKSSNQNENRKTADRNPSQRTSPTELAYNILEMPSESHANMTWEDIKKQFRVLTLKYHPDMPNGNGAQMAQILDAYAFLKKLFRS